MANRKSLMESLDWARFTGKESGSRFQSLALDLLAERLDEDSFSPPPTHAGPDGGWDGLYEGTIDGFKGRWKIACAVRKTLSALKKKASEENSSAQRDEADALLLITSHDLTIPELKTVEEIVGDGLKKGRVWPRSRLERQLDQYPWQAARHFGLAYLAGFVRLQEFADDHFRNKDLPLVGREVAVETLKTFLDDNGKILLLAAPGGAGKSRLLRELAGITKRMPRRSRPEPWLRQINCGSIQDELSPLLRRQRPLVLCLDDAGASLGEVVELARLVTTRDDLDLKLVLAARSADLALVQRALRETTVRHLALTDLSQEAALSLVSTEFPDLSSDLAARLSRHFGHNLHVLRAAARAVSSGSSSQAILADENLRGFLSDRLLAEAGTLMKRSEDLVEECLLRVALDAPLPASILTADLDIATLVEGGLLAHVGNTVRFRHDVDGDLLLAHLASLPRGRALLQKLIAARSNSMHHVVRNLAAAGEGHQSSLIKTICDGWRQEARRTTIATRRAVLSVLPYCVSAASAEVSSICGVYQLEPPVEATDPLEQLRSKRPLTTADFGPTIVALATRGGAIVEALRLCLSMAQYGVEEGSDSNHKLAALGAEVVSPTHQPPEKVRTALSELTTWSKQVGLEAQKASVWKAVLPRLLGRSVSWTSSDDLKITMHETSFEPTEAVVAIRRLALDLLLRLLSHSSVVVRQVAAEIAAGFDWHIGRVSTASMNAIVREELGRLLPVLEQRLAVESDVGVLDTTYAGLVKRWASQKEGADSAGEILRRWDRPLLVSAYQFIEHYGSWQPDTHTMLDAAPTVDRWTWWVHSEFRGIQEHDAKPLIRDIEVSCSSDEHLLATLDVITRGRNPFWLLDPWSEAHPTRFEDLASRGDLPASFRAMVSRTLRRRRYRHRPEATVSDLQPFVDAADIDGILALREDGRFPAHVLKTFATELVKHGEIRIRAMGLEMTGHSVELDATSRVELLAKAVRDGNWTGAWRDIWGVLNQLDTRDKVPIPPPVVALVLDRIAESLATFDRFVGTNDEWGLKESLAILTRENPAAHLRVVGSTLGPETSWTIGEFVSPLLKTIDGVRHLANAAQIWVAENRIDGAEGVARLLRTALERSSMPQGSLELAIELVDAGNAPQRRAVGLSFLAELRASPEACAELAEIAADPSDGLYSDAKELLDRLDRPGGAWNSPQGEVPPAFKAIRDKLAASVELCRSTGARLLIAEVQRSTEEWIEHHLRDDEEFAQRRRYR